MNKNDFINARFSTILKISFDFMRGFGFNNNRTQYVSEMQYTGNPYTHYD